MNFKNYFWTTVIRFWTDIIWHEWLFTSCSRAERFIQSCLRAVHILELVKYTLKLLYLRFNILSSLENKIVCQFFILKQVSKTTHKLTIMTRKHTHAPIFTRSDATMWTFTNYTYQQGILAKNINSTEVINNCSLNKLYLSPSKYTRMFCGVGENWAFMLFFCRLLCDAQVAQMFHFFIFLCCFFFFSVYW